ncbi:hypothetical protein ACLG6S_15350 [Thermodesulfobacteriota bacterium B35]
MLTLAVFFFEEVVVFFFLLFFSRELDSPFLLFDVALFFADETVCLSGFLLLDEVADEAARTGREERRKTVVRRTAKIR